MIAAPINNLLLGIPSTLSPSSLDVASSAFSIGSDSGTGIPFELYSASLPPSSFVGALVFQICRFSSLPFFFVMVISC